MTHKLRRRILAVGEEPVPLNDTFPKSVAFVVGTYMKDGLPRTGVKGTAFLIQLQSDAVQGLAFWYVVTAAHVVRPLADSAIRLNLKAGGTHDWVVHHWFFHPTEDVAVAILAVGGDHDFKTIPDNAFADKWDRAPNLGDRVYFLGLLAEMTEMAKTNVPMVRSGTLGALYQPGIPVEVAPSTPVLMTGHLIDCRSYGGFSGSPCFVQFSEIRQVRTNRPDLVGVAMGDTTLLLGMVVAHYDLRRDAILTGDFAGSSGGVQTEINTGVGVVLPVERIREALMDEELVDLRREHERRVKKEAAPAATADVALEAEPTLLRKDFESALKRKAVSDS